MYLLKSFLPKGQYMPACPEAHVLKEQFCTQLRRLWGTPLEAVSSLAFFLSMLFQSSLFQFHCLEPCKVLTEFGFRHYAFCNWMPTNSWNELTPRLLPLQVLIWRCWYGNKNMNLKQTKKPEEEVPGWVHPTELISKSLISSGVLPGEEAAVWALHSSHEIKFSMLPQIWWSTYAHQRWRMARMAHGKYLHLTSPCAGRKRYAKTGTSSYLGVWENNI